MPKVVSNETAETGLDYKQRGEPGQTYIISASGRPGWIYPKMNSVRTFSPIWLLVTA